MTEGDVNVYQSTTTELITARSHNMIPPLQNVYNGLIRPTLLRTNPCCYMGQTSRHRTYENIIASTAQSLRKHKRVHTCRYMLDFGFLLTRRPVIFRISRFGLWPNLGAAFL